MKFHRPAYFAPLLVALLISPVFSERPSSTKIITEHTVAYVRIADVQEYKEKFSQIAIGRALQDPELQPFINGFWATLDDTFGDTEAQLGITIDEILSIPQGELAAGLISMEAGPPALMIFCDLGEDTRNAENAIRVLKAIAEADGSNHETSKFKDSEILTVHGKDGPLSVCIHQNTLLVSNRVEAVEDSITHWDGEREDSLRNDDRFKTIASASRGTKDEPAQLIWYVNPIDLMRTLLRDSPASGYVMAFMPVLGLDGIKGIGGGAVMATEDFDQVTHMHILLERPRTGVLEAIALKHANPEPDVWVPEDVTNYISADWDVEKTYGAVEKLYDNIMFEGAMARDIERRINEPTGINFRSEIIDNLDGRFTLVQWYEPPARINSQASIVVAKVKDRSSMQRTVDHLFETIPMFKDRFEQQHFGDASFYQLNVQSLPIPEDASEERIARIKRRREMRPQPCIGLIGDYLFFADRPGIVEHVAMVYGGDKPRLNEDLSYKLIMGKLEDHAQGNKIGMVSFARPEEALRMWYELVNADSTKQFINRQGENNDFFRNLGGHLEATPLPDYHVISKYLAPSGSVMYDDETGLHFIGFEMKRESAE